MTAAEIRQQFLDYFKSKAHQIVPSAPIVIKNDPTLLFTNAGMNQFKDYFLGNKEPQSKRIADTQKCLRVSGKHNDLEEVGVDTYHHTMFEMLGNWSFGDYFKKEAIEWSWELLTKVYQIPKDRLYVTIFEGDEKEGLPKDEEALNEWKKHISEDRILLGNKKDNFWEMGDTGPCGPCTEIHVDCRSEEERKLIDGKTLVNADHPQVIEIWNNVFIQFNRLKDGSLSQLPAKHVDTGMGFERLVRVLQNKQSNYDTDIFTPTISATENIVGIAYTAGDDKTSIAFRVIADHIRAIGFTIADGQLPSNTGAGYVIRRILRRAVRYYYSYLNYKQPLLHQLLPVIANSFEAVFPELKAQEAFVAKVIKEEEEAFLRTLEKGLKKIDDIIANATTSKIIQGKDAFELFDTYGFPLDLTKLIASEHQLTVDEIAFEAAMQEQKNRSRAASIIDAEDWVSLSEMASSTFVGYHQTIHTTQVIKYRKATIKGKTNFQIVLEQTPFYAESGGQVGDTGVLQFDEETIPVLDTKKENNLIIHFTSKLPENFGKEVVAKVNEHIRLNTAAHHTATHLLHAALRKVLGSHVQQKGSLVNAEQLRFDFAHFSKVTDEQIAEVEQIVNEKIRANIDVTIEEMSKEDALRKGAMALFGEKYGDKVRVVTIDPNFSIELCGGTHVKQTGSLGFFKIIHESAVAAGVRRIEAVVGVAAEEYIQSTFNELHQIKQLVKPNASLLKSINQILAEQAQFKKQIEAFEAKATQQTFQQLLANVQKIGEVVFVGSQVDATSGDTLKQLCFELKKYFEHQQIKKYAVVLTANLSGKANVAILLSDAVVETKQLEAPSIIKQHITPLIKGGGGGQKTLATAGGQDASNLAQVIEKVKSLL